MSTSKLAESIKHLVNHYLSIRKSTLEDKGFGMKPADVNEFNTQSDMIARSMITDLESNDPAWWDALAEVASMCGNMLRSQKGRSN